MDAGFWVFLFFVACLVTVMARASRFAVVSKVQPPAVIDLPHASLRVVMSPRQYHQRLYRKFQARERRNVAAGTREQRYITEKRHEILCKHASGKPLTRDDILSLMPVRKQDAAKLYDQATCKRDDELSDTEFVARYRKPQPAA